MKKSRLRQFIPIAAILAMPGMNVQGARDARPPDVTVYVSGDDWPPLVTYSRAIDSVTRMYARVGIRLAWLGSSPPRGWKSRSALAIQVQFAGERTMDMPLDAMAFARPFASGASAIIVMYQRVRTSAGGSSREQALLAYVLAHEIGHVLQGVDRHSETGVMKPRLTVADYAATVEKPLEFTPDDVDLMVKGLTVLRSKTSPERPRP